MDFIDKIYIMEELYPPNKEVPVKISDLSALVDELDVLRFEMKEIYNNSCFEWGSMPEAGRRQYQKIVLDAADRALSFKYKSSK